MLLLLQTKQAQCMRGLNLWTFIAYQHHVWIKLGLRSSGIASGSNCSRCSSVRGKTRISFTRQLHLPLYDTISCAESPTLSHRACNYQQIPLHVVLTEASPTVMRGCQKIRPYVRATFVADRDVRTLWTIACVCLVLLCPNCLPRCAVRMMRTSVSFARATVSKPSDLSKPV